MEGRMDGRTDGWMEGGREVNGQGGSFARVGRSGLGPRTAGGHARQAGRAHPQVKWRIGRTFFFFLKRCISSMVGLTSVVCSVFAETALCRKPSLS